MTIEISFPRGGRKPSPNAKPQNTKQDPDLFGRKRKKVIKHASKTNVYQAEETSNITEIQNVEQLSLNTIQDGMILIGYVKEIQRVALQVSLPGKLWGKVFVNNISKPYLKILQTVVDQNETEDYKQLNELFTLGQCVAVKVLNLNDEKFGITLSMMPQQINANISHTNVKSGMTLWGAISEVEDHGYVVDLGINNCRAFLMKENCDAGTNYAVGELLWFAIIKTDISSTATTVMLSANEEKIKKIKIIDDMSLDHLLPGMQIDFTISEILSNGLEGKFLNDYTGYIDGKQFKKPYYDKNVYKINKVLEARILYTMPVTKIAYFTLKSLEIHKKGEVEDGAIVNCTIQRVTPFSIYIKLLNSDSRGLVPLYRVDGNNAFRHLQRKYPKHSTHQCRILNFDYFGQIYICSLESELVDENMIFTLDNLKTGQVVPAEITEIRSNGLVVKIQQVNGFIKNEHLCDTVLKQYSKMLSRFKVGQTVKARVWVVNKTKCLLYLTIRPSLLKTLPILKDYQEAKENEQFLGVVRQIKTTGILVQFFGDVYGWVPKKKMLFKKEANLASLFKIGQLVQCTVVNCKNTKLTLSLYSSSEITEDEQPELKLGQHVDAIVSYISNEGIHVTVKNLDISAFIPTLYLSKFPKLAPVIAKMHKPEDEISDLVCVNKNDTLPTLSLRNSELNEDNILNIKSLKEDMIISGSVSTTDHFGINVEAPIENFRKTILVPKETISDDRNVTVPNLKLNQLIYAKVLNISKNFETVTASTKLSEVWDYDIQSSVHYLSEYLKEVLRIREYLKSLNNPVASLGLGEIVSGIVVSVNNDKSCTVQLNNDARAIAQSEYVEENISVNDSVEGVVLFWNFEDNVAEIALCPKLITRINQLQNGVIDIPAGVTNKSNAHAEVLLVKETFTLGVLRGSSGKRQFIFFPSRLHPNDLMPNLSNYVIGNYISIQINKIENGLIIGLLKQQVKDMKYKWRKILKKKLELENIHSEKQPESKRMKLEILNEVESKKDMKKKEKKHKESVIIRIEPEDVVNEEIQTNIETVKIKKEKKTSISTDDEILEEIKIKKEPEEINSVPSDEDIVEKIKLNKKDKKKKNCISTDEEIIDEIKKTKKNRKKNSISNVDEFVENTPDIVNEKINKKQKKRKLDEENEQRETQTSNNQPSKKSKQKPIIEDVPVVLPGADNFWNIEEPQNVKEESSDDDEPDQKQLEKLQKKKKPTQAERAEAARLEEERIRKIELELADAENIPKTADQFDRLVLANPNNSMFWINYMAFHLEATEIEKARAIARKALNTIEFREEQEKLNVWIAFLNLENRYGTKESFASVLEEAVKMNDSLSIYLQSLNILSESKKTIEFLELVKTVSRKFKQEFKMWTATAEACYKCDLKEEARSLMQRSLKSLDEKQHINILVQFAFMEVRYNEPERAEALLEKVLASYPRRVDVWTSYVDMLIKGNRIHIARNLLQRSVGQKLPARKMKTLFSKYVQFETKYGDEESVQKVRKLAANYVKTALN